VVKIVERRVIGTLSVNSDAITSDFVKETTNDTPMWLTSTNVEIVV